MPNQMPWLSSVRTWPAEIYYKQESPPAWTQEAYRPPRSKCSLCCSVGGVPHPDLARGGGGVPHPDLTWSNPPPPPPGPGYHPERTWDQWCGKEPGTGVPPWKGHGTSDLGKNMGLGYPPSQMWTDKQTENITIPHPSDAGGNKLMSARSNNRCLQPVLSTSAQYCNLDHT